MSKEIEEKVVEMRFDNEQFEKNVKTSIESVKNLKKNLDFSGAEKGLDSINDSVKKVNFSSLSDSIETVKVKLSSMQVVAATVLSNITTSVMGAVSKLTSAVYSSVVQGGIKRSMNIEQAKFQIDGLGASWEELSEDISYAVDGTAYGMDVAAKAASQLTASNIEAGDSMKTALRAISGVAAMTNSEYEDISRVFTTVAGNGRLMGDQLLQLSSRGLNAAATLASYLNVTEAEVRDMVSSGEVDFATFAAAMDDAFGEHAADANKTFSGSLSNVKAALARIGADVATPALENLRDVFNALREKINAVHEELGPFIDTINKLQTKAAKAAVNFLNGTSSSWTKLTKKIEKAGVSTEDFQNELEKTAKDAGVPIDDLIEKYGSLEASFSDGWLTNNIVAKTLRNIASASSEVSENVTDVTDKLEYFQTLFDNMWRGDYDNGADIRISKMGDAGTYYAIVQRLVNKNAAGTTLTIEDLTDAIGDLSDAELESAGYTEEQIESLQKLADRAEKTGTPIYELIEDLSKPTPRDLLISTAKNVFANLKTIVKSMVKAWNELFSDTKIENLYDIAEAIQSISENMVLNDEKADKLKRTFKGLFAVVDILQRGIGKTLTAAFKGLSKVIRGMPDFNLLGGTAKIGDALVALDEYLKKNEFLDKAYESVGSAAEKAGKKIGGFVNKLKESTKASDGVSKKLTFGSLKSNIGTLKTYVLKAATAIKSGWSKFIDKLKENEKVATIIENFSKVFKKLVSAIKKINLPGLDDVVEFFSTWKEYLVDNNYDGNAVETIAGSLKYLREQISKTFTPIKETVVGALLTWLNTNGEKLKSFKTSLGHIPDTALKVWNTLKNLTSKVQDVLSSMNLSEWIDTGKSIAVIWLIYKIGKALEAFSQIPSSIAGLISNVGGAFQAWSKQMKYKNIKILAESVAIIAASIFVLATLTDANKAWVAIEQIGVVIGMLVAAITILTKLNGVMGSLKIEGFAASVLGFAAGLFIMTLAFKMIKNEKWSDVKDGFYMLITMLGILAAAATVFSRLGGGFSTSALAILAFGTALNLMVSALYKYNKMSWDEYENGMKKLVVVLGLFVLAVGILNKTNQGKGMIGTAAAMLAFVVSLSLLRNVLKKYADLKWDEFGRAAAMLGILGVEMAALMRGLNAASKGGGSAKLLVSLSAALVAIVGAIVVLGILPLDIAIQGAAVLGGVALAVGGALKLMSGVNKTQIAAITVMGAIIIAMGVIINYLAQLPIGNVISSAVSLAGLIIAMGVVVKLINVGLSLPEMAVALLAIGAMTAVVAATALVIQYLAKSTPERALTSATALSEIIVAMGVACKLLCSIPIPGALAALANLAIFAAGFIAFLGVLGAIVNHSNAGSAIESGLNIIIMIADKIGEAIGSFIASIGTTIADSMPGIADNLSSFADKIQPFFNLMSDIDRSVLAGATFAAAAIMEFAVADFITGLMDILSFGHDMEDTGKELSAFAENASGFFDTMKDIGADTMSSTEAVVSSLVKLSKTKFGVFKQNNLVKFGKSLNDLVTPLKDFNSAMLGVDSGKLRGWATALQNMADALEDAADLGKVNLDDFGSALSSFGDNCLAVDTESIMNVADVLMDISNVSKDVSTEGINSLIQAVQSLTSVSYSAGYDASTSFVDGFSDGSVDMEEACNELGITMDMSMDGLSDISYSNGSEMMSALGLGMDSSSSDVLNVLDSLAGDGVLTIDGYSSDFFNEGGSLASILGDGINSSGGSVISAITSLIQSGKANLDSSFANYTASGSSLANSTAQGINSQESVDAVEQSSSELADAAASSLISKETSARLKAAGQQAGQYMVDGVAKSFETPNKATKAVYDFGLELHRKLNSATEINSPSKLFMESGAYIVEGVALGIKNNTGMATDATEEMGGATIQTMRKAVAMCAAIADCDIDVQPTISPVVDLSGVYDGVASINSTFGGMNFGIGTYSSARSASNAFQERQNENLSLISAIKDLQNSFNADQQATNVTVNLDYNAGEDANKIAQDIATSLRRAVRRG